MQKEFCEDCGCMQLHKRIWDEDKFVRLGDNWILTYVKELQCQKCGATIPDESNEPDIREKKEV